MARPDTGLATKIRLGWLNMNKPSHDTGVLITLLERLEKQKIPNARALEKKVNRGETLSDYDLKFLANVINDLRKTRPIVTRHPEYQPLIAGFIDLCQEITDKALANEKTSG
jgi:hypothetical protein